MAYKKECPKCNSVSYSSNRRGWICPYCGEDIDEVEIKIANN